MQVYISVDMEGIAGIATFDQTIRGGRGYPRAQQLMTEETNAAIAGAFDAGADAVLVNDSHGTMDNLLHDALDPRARLLFGSPKLDCMAEGLTAEHDVARFLGYHAPAGGPGVLAHTFSGFFTEVRLNGAPVSEADVNALLAATTGVPVGLVSGDDVICRLAQAAFPGARTAQVKQAHSFAAADSLSPAMAREVIRREAAAAVRGAAELRPVPVPDRLRLAIDVPTILAADLAESIPGTVRTAIRTIEADLDRPRDVIGLISVAYELTAAGLRPMMSVLNRT
ncbi:MAG TPA: M55 family metallopeptidase [Nakamurella sp.]|nr:M55 family metallopeptidase [Nakamurella sp.]